MALVITVKNFNGQTIDKNNDRYTTLSADTSIAIISIRVE